MKRWRCTVCGYIHTGDSPPETCPECGVGPEFFELIGEVENVILTPEKKAQVLPALFKISYGLFVITSVSEGKANGQICNTLFQVTSDPVTLAMGINKSTLTHQLIQDSGLVGISVLGKEAIDIVKSFGYRSGRDVDKLSGVSTQIGSTGVPLLNEAIATLEGKVRKEQTVDLGTHSLFLLDVVDGRLINDVSPLTYEEFRAKK